MNSYTAFRASSDLYESRDLRLGITAGQAPSILTGSGLFLAGRPPSGQLIGHLGQALTFLLPLCHQIVHTPSG